MKMNVLKVFFVILSLGLCFDGIVAGKKRDKDGTQGTWQAAPKPSKDKTKRKKKGCKSGACKTKRKRSFRKGNDSYL